MKLSRLIQVSQYAATTGSISAPPVRLARTGKAALEGELGGMPASVMMRASQVMTWTGECQQGGLRRSVALSLLSELCHSQSASPGLSAPPRNLPGAFLRMGVISARMTWPEAFHWAAAAA